MLHDSDGLDGLKLITGRRQCQTIQLTLWHAEETSVGITTYSTARVGRSQRHCNDNRRLPSMDDQTSCCQRLLPRLSYRSPPRWPPTLRQLCPDDLRVGHPLTAGQRRLTERLILFNCGTTDEADVLSLSADQVAAAVFVAASNSDSNSDSSNLLQLLSGAVI